MLNFLRKIPAHGTKCRTFSWSVEIIPKFVGTILILVRIILTPQEDILHFVPCVGIFLIKFNSAHGNISYKIL